MSADFMQFLDSVGKYDHKENKHAVGAIYILWWVSHDYADRQFGQQWRLQANKHGCKHFKT